MAELEARVRALQAENHCLRHKLEAVGCDVEEEEGGEERGEEGQGSVKTEMEDEKGGEGEGGREGDEKAQSVGEGCERERERAGERGRDAKAEGEEVGGGEEGGEGGQRVGAGEQGSRGEEEESGREEEESEGEREAVTLGELQARALFSQALHFDPAALDIQVRAPMSAVCVCVWSRVFAVLRRVTASCEWSLGADSERKPAVCARLLLRPARLRQMEVAHPSVWPLFQREHYIQAPDIRVHALLSLPLPFPTPHPATLGAESWGWWSRARTCTWPPCASTRARLSGWLPCARGQARTTKRPPASTTGAIGSRVSWSSMWPPPDAPSRRASVAQRSDLHVPDVAGHRDRERDFGRDCQGPLS